MGRGLGSVSGAVKVDERKQSGGSLSLRTWKSVQFDDDANKGICGDMARDGFHCRGLYVKGSSATTCRYSTRRRMTVYSASSASLS